MSDTTPYDLSVQVAFDGAGVMPVDRLERAMAWVLRRHASVPGTGVTVVIVSDDEIRRMNRQYRGVDSTTDVLSFPADPVPVPDAIGPYLGDLIVALPTIQRQAAVEGHAWTDEMVLAVVHGTLHLLGYDHDTAVHQGEMWAVQAEALAALDVPIVVPVFEFPDDDESDAATSAVAPDSH